MFSEEEWSDIVWGIYRLTRNDQVVWEKSGDPWAEYYSLSPTAETEYRLSSKDNDGQFPYILEVYRNGSDLPFASYVAEPFHEGDEAVSEALDGLFGLVSRAVTGAPQLAKTLLEELRALETRVSNSPDEVPF